MANALFEAALDVEYALANHWHERKTGLFQDANFGASKTTRETFFWIIVSDEQKQSLRRRPLRKALNVFTEQFIQNVKRPL